MKTRDGFVSNSSSSSFLVVGRLIGDKFSPEEVEKYMEEHDLEDEAEAMLDRVIRKKTGVKSVIPFIGDGYIDHQSSASEDRNTEMFNSEQDLEDFLFGAGSCIQCDNDNH